MTVVSRRAMLEQIIAEGAIEPLFQPIVDLATRRVVGVEALARGPAGSPLFTPDALFDAAVREGLLHEIDTLSATRALQTVNRYEGELPPLVFINADPGALIGPPTPELRSAIRQQGPYRVVLEFTERALGANPTGLLDVAGMVHHVGNGLALDDVGAEPLSLALLPLIEPEVVKLDMHLIRDPYAAHSIGIAGHVGAYAEQSGAKIIAEGIETEQDLSAALALGAQWGQGWLFGRPGPLADLRGRHLDAYAALRPSRPGLHRPAEAALGGVGAVGRTRRADTRFAAGFAAQLIDQAAAAGQRGVLLAAIDHPAELSRWLPEINRLAATVGFAGVSTPPGVTAGAGVHHAITAASDGEAILAVITPQTSAVLRLRHDPSGTGVDLSVTHDPDIALPLARTLFGRFGSRIFPGLGGGRPEHEALAPAASQAALRAAV